MTAASLYRKHSMQDLLDMISKVEADPANKTAPGTLWIYTAKARKKLDAIRMAVSFHMADRRKADGETVPTCGYSGRNSNRRR